MTTVKMPLRLLAYRSLLVAFCGFILLATSAESYGQRRTAKVFVQLDLRHDVGGESEFDRQKYINIHSTPAEPDWRGEEEKLSYLVDELGVNFGRDSGKISWEIKQLIEDPKHPGFVDFDFMENRGNFARSEYSKQKHIHQYQDQSDIVVAAQVHPFWPHGNSDESKITPKNGEPWSLANPEATAQYMVYWLNMYTGGNGAPRPRLLEVMNEPLFELQKNDSDLEPKTVFQYHNRVAKFIRELNGDIKIGGYTAAFPDFEKRDFKRWEERWKSFIDIAGTNLDFYSLHLYDFPGIDNGKQQYRKGSNLEATFDMLEHYNHVKYGKVKPFVISEYGSQLHDWFDEPWSPYRDWLCLKANNSMLIQFLQKPNVILKSIPFVTAKAEWGFNQNGFDQPYCWRLLRRENEPEAYTGNYVFTEQIKFYELWSKVKGTRIATKSSDSDLLVDAYVDGHRAFLILNNLTEGSIEIDARLGGGSDNEIKQTYAKHLYLYENKPRLDTAQIKDLKQPLILGSEATMIVEYAFGEQVSITRTMKEKKSYAKTIFQRIKRNETLKFEIGGVPQAAKTIAVLRLGIGRDHGSSLSPTVDFNGTRLLVPENIKGPSQKERGRFFGVLEIPVPEESLKSNNTVSVNFPDDGGHVSSVILQTLSW